MKFFSSVLLMALLSFSACLFMPWWSIAIACFIVSLIIPQKSGWAFLSGFISLFMLWFSLCFWISKNNNHILAHKISLLILKVDHPIALILFTAFIGALVGGFASLTGSLMRKSSVAN